MRRMTEAESAEHWRQIREELSARWAGVDQSSMTDDQIDELEAKWSNEIEARLMNEWEYKRDMEEEAERDR